MGVINLKSVEASIIIVPRQGGAVGAGVAVGVDVIKPSLARQMLKFYEGFSVFLQKNL